MSKYLIVNFDRKEYLRPEAFGERGDLKSVVMSQEGVLTGLTVLLADGNNRGGGDLRSDAEVIGSWAGHRVAVIDDVVADVEFSEPGMEHLPLQHQMLSLGRDISPVVIAAICEGEGGRCPLAQLNEKLTLSLVEQRELPGRGAEFYATSPNRKTKPLEDLEDLFWVLGVGAGLTPYMARKRLQEGLTKMATLFGRAERYEVGAVTVEHGVKPVHLDRWSEERQKGEGVVSLTAELRDTAAEGRSVTLTARFGPKGTTLEKLFEQVFPNQAFEKHPSLASSVCSPEVAKLLSMIPLNEEAS